MKSFLGGLYIACWLGAAAFAVFALRFNDKLKVENILQPRPGAKGALLRLHTPEGRFICSATVFNDNFAVTAAHCGPMNTIFTVTDSSDEAAIIGTVVAQSIPLDISIVMGDFSEFSKMPILTKTSDIVNILNSQPQLVGCGFPHGGRAFCTALEDWGHQDTELYAKGFIYHGMSGGPVYDEKTGKQIAIIVAVNGEKSLLVPLVEIIRMFELPIKDEK